MPTLVWEPLDTHYTLLVFADDFFFKIGAIFQFPFLKFFSIGMKMEVEDEALDVRNFGKFFKVFDPSLLSAYVYTLNNTYQKHRGWLSSSPNEL